MSSGVRAQRCYDKFNASHPSDSDAKPDKAHARMYIKDRVCFALVLWEAAALMY